MAFKGIDENDQIEFANSVNRVREEVAGKHTKKYTPPTTKEEYWDVVDEYWEELLAIIIKYTSVDVNHCTKLKNDRNIELVKQFSNAWWNAPDNGTIHLIPCWNVLCDLCSANYLVYEE